MEAEVLAQETLARQAGVHVLRLAPGCVCCSSRLVLTTHLGRTMRLNPPALLILELDTTSHSQTIAQWLQEPDWHGWFSAVRTHPVNFHA
ncbi:MAG: hypothetical protein HC848_00785 [Limnobacter sp.]|nr:hypothetical protein [Limnobacter sp.]